MRTDQLLREFDLEPVWRVFPLHPETPESGMTLEELFAGRGYDLPAMRARLRTVAEELGLPLGERTRTFNSRRAQELGKWAEEQGQAEAFHQAVYRAYFVDGRNIAEPGELATLTEVIGLSGEEARRVLSQGKYAAAVDADWKYAGELGVTAVPTLVFRGRALVGFQPYAAFRQLIDG